MSKRKNGTPHLYERKGRYYGYFPGYADVVGEQRYRESLHTRDQVVARHRFGSRLKEPKQARVRMACRLAVRGVPIKALGLLQARLNDAASDMVYVVYQPATNTVKIGHSVNVLKRLASLQSANGDGLEVLALLQGGRELEHSLHARWQRLRRHGEWFSLDLAFVQWLEERRGQVGLPE